MLRSLPIARTRTSPEFRPIRTLTSTPWAPRSVGRLALHGALDRQRRVAGAHRMVLMRDRRAEQRHDAVAHDPVDGALVAVHARPSSRRAPHPECRRASSGSASSISASEPLTSANSTVTCLRSPSSAARERRTRSARCLGVRASSDGRGLGPSAASRSGDRGEQLLAVAERSDAELLQIVRRERAQDLGVDVVRRECFGVLAEAVVLQPGADVHRRSRMSVRDHHSGALAICARTHASRRSPLRPREQQGSPGHPRSVGPAQWRRQPIGSGPYFPL